MLLKQVLNNLPISLEGPWNYIFTNVSIKVNLFRQKNVYYIYNYVHKSMENFLFWNKYSFSSYVFFKNVGNDYTLKDYSQKIKKILSILRRLRIKQIYGEDYIFKKFSTRSS